MSSGLSTELRGLTEPGTASPPHSGQAGEEMAKRAASCTLGFPLKQDLFSPSRDITQETASLLCKTRLTADRYTQGSVTFSALQGWQRPVHVSNRRVPLLKTTRCL